MTRRSGWLMLLASSLSLSLSRALSTAPASQARKVVFLGTPDVAQQTLATLLEAAEASGEWSVAAVVTQPPSLVGRGKKRALTPSPVHQLAESHGVPVLAPDRARDEEFLTTLEEMAPDLCITAAYGQFLPKRFLAIPKLGTLNVHPSLLPRWRGASPVQRSLEAGDEVGGVSVVWTVLKMDAGPIAAQVEERFNGDEKAPQVLEHLFHVGTASLVDLLPKVWSGECTPESCPKQDEELAVPADKISPAEAHACFQTESALTVHNRLRGFAGWPGVFADFQMTLISDPEGSEWEEPQRIKLITTRVASPADLNPPIGSNHPHDSSLLRCLKGKIFVPCADGTVLEVLELQQANKKAMDAKSFFNGLRGRQVRWLPRPPPPELADAK